MIWFGCDAIRGIVSYPHLREAQKVPLLMVAIYTVEACEGAVAEIGKVAAVVVVHLSSMIVIFSVAVVDPANRGVDVTGWWIAIEIETWTGIVY